MNYIVFDLEMNEIDKSLKSIRKVCPREIIEIGAVKLDENLKIISRFNCLVKPRYSKMDSKCQSITKITDEMLENAKDFSVAMDDFMKWIKSDTKEYELYSWSENDIEQLLDESFLKDSNIDDVDELNNNWYDFQIEFGEAINLHSRMSLKRACKWSNVEIVGQEHRALDDAENTATLFRYCRDSVYFDKYIKRSSITINSSEGLTSTMGDLFKDYLSKFAV